MVGTLVFLHFKHKPKKSLYKYETSSISPSVSHTGAMDKLNTPPPNRNLDLSNGNLFDPKRGYIPPPPKKEKVEPLPSKVRENIELIGIIKTKSYAFAFIQNKNKKNDVKPKSYYTVGDEVHNGWSITAIEPNKIIIGGGNKKDELILNRSDKHSLERNKAGKSAYVKGIRGPRKTREQRKFDKLKSKRKSRMSRLRKKR